MGAAWAALALLLAPAPADGTLTWAQVRQLSPEALSRRLFGDLSQIVHPLPPWGGSQAGPLGRLDFLSRARGAQAAGMCESDFITVMFAPPGRTPDADPPVRPRSVSVSTLYFVRDLALVRSSGPPSYGNDRALDVACAGVDPRDHPLMSGHGSPLGAVRNVADLVEAARAGRPLAPLDCSALRGRGIAMTQAACLRVLAGLRPEDIEREENCGTGPGHWDACRMVVLRPYEIEFHLSGPTSAPVRIGIFPTRSERIALFRRNLREAPAPAPR